MNKNLTEVVFILDRSGSMSGLEDDTIGGYNSFLERQKNENGECFISTVLFNQKSTVIHDRIRIDQIQKMTRDDYFPSGTTALIDAMGDAIHHISNIHKYIREEDVPANTIFVIITDGMENASFRYTSDEVKKMVEQKKEKGWEFLFLAANIDAVETAKKYGIDEGHSADFLCDEQGLEVNYRSISETVSCLRAGKALPKNWNKEINKDFTQRKK